MLRHTPSTRSSSSTSSSSSSRSSVVPVQAAVNRSDNRIPPRPSESVDTQQQPTRTSNSIRWSPSSHTIDLPTDSYGTVEFQGGPHPTKAKYVRLHYETHPDNIIHLLLHEWRLRVPSLVISALGGLANSPLQTKLQRVIQSGLLKAAKTTGAWIVTNGLDTGVTRHIGEALKDEVHVRNSNIVVLGIAPWGYVQQREALVGLNKTCSYYSQGGNRTRGARQELALNSHHNYFLLTDNGTNGKLGSDGRIRRRLETLLIQQPIDMRRYGGSKSRIPVVGLLIDGGAQSFQTVFDMVTSRHPVPVVVCDGSGRAADLLAFMHRHANDQYDLPSVLRDQLMFVIMRAFQVQRSEADQLYSQMQLCLKRRDLIRIFRMGESETDEIDITILTALLQVSRQKLTPAEQLSLTMAWDRPDIARSKVFASSTNWSMQTLENAMADALLNDRLEFVRLLLAKGVDMQRFLTVRRLEELYLVSGDPNNRAFHRLFTKVMGNRQRKSLRTIGLLIASLIGGGYQHAYCDKYRPASLLSSAQLITSYAASIGGASTHRPDSLSIAPSSTVVAGDLMSPPAFNQDLSPPDYNLQNGSAVNRTPNTTRPSVASTSSSMRKCSTTVDLGRLTTNDQSGHRQLGFGFKPPLRDSSSSNRPPPTVVSSMLSNDLKFRYPYSELLQWALLTRRHKIARFLVLAGEESIAKALFAVKLLRSLRHLIADVGHDNDELLNTYREYESTFEQLAVDLQDHCYRQDPVQAKRLLTYELSNFSKNTCLSLAYACESKVFIAHPCTQSILNDMWYGGLRQRQLVDVKIILILLTLPLPPLVAFCLSRQSRFLEFKTKEELAQQPQTLREHLDELEDTSTSSSSSSSSSGSDSSSSSSSGRSSRSSSPDSGNSPSRKHGSLRASSSAKVHKISESSATGQQRPVSQFSRASFRRDRLRPGSSNTKAKDDGPSDSDQAPVSQTANESNQPLTTRLSATLLGGNNNKRHQRNRRHFRRRRRGSHQKNNENDARRGTANKSSERSGVPHRSNLIGLIPVGHYASVAAAVISPPRRPTLDNQQQQQQQAPAPPPLSDGTTGATAYPSLTGFSSCQTSLTKANNGGLKPLPADWNTMPGGGGGQNVSNPYFVHHHPAVMDHRHHQQHAYYWYDRDPSMLHESEHQLSWRRRVHEFFSAPITRFYLHVLMYLLFLILFIGYCIHTLPLKQFSLLELYIFLHIITYFLDKFREVKYSAGATYFQKLRVHLHAFWNIYDFIMCLISITGIILRYASLAYEPMYMWAKNLLIICCAFWQLRFFELMQIWRFCGTYIYMLFKMIMVMVPMLSLLFLPLVAFGTLREGIMYPNRSEVGLTGIKGVLLEPYFMLYGEVYAGEIDPISWPDEESRQAPFLEAVPIATVIYLLYSIILFISVIIATFNDLYSRIRQQSELVYNYIRYAVIIEYESRPLLPPPFVVLSWIYMLIDHLIRLVKHRRFYAQAGSAQPGNTDLPLDSKSLPNGGGGSPSKRQPPPSSQQDKQKPPEMPREPEGGFGLKLFLKPEEVEKLHDFEEECVDDYWRALSKKEVRDAQCQEETMHSKMDQMNIQLSELADRQAYLGGLVNMTQQDVASLTDAVDHRHSSSSDSSDGDQSPRQHRPNPMATTTDQQHSRALANALLCLLQQRQQTTSDQVGSVTAGAIDSQLASAVSQLAEALSHRPPTPVPAPSTTVNLLTPPPPIVGGLARPDESSRSRPRRRCRRRNSFSLNNNDFQFTAGLHQDFYRSRPGYPARFMATTTSLRGRHPMCREYTTICDELDLYCRDNSSSESTTTPTGSRLDLLVSDAAAATNESRQAPRRRRRRRRLSSRAAEFRASFIGQSKQPVPPSPPVLRRSDDEDRRARVGSVRQSRLMMRRREVEGSCQPSDVDEYHSRQGSPVEFERQQSNQSHDADAHDPNYLSLPPPGIHHQIDRQSLYLSQEFNQSPSRYSIVNTDEDPVYEEEHANTAMNLQPPPPLLRGPSQSTPDIRLEGVDAGHHHPSQDQEPEVNR